MKKKTKCGHMNEKGAKKEEIREKQKEKMIIKNMSKVIKKGFKCLGFKYKDVWMFWVEEFRKCLFEVRFSIFAPRCPISCKRCATHSN